MREKTSRYPPWLLVVASRGLPTMREGIHRPGRRYNDDTKALLKAGGSVNRRAHSCSTGHSVFLADGEDFEQGSYDVRVGRVATQPHRHGQIPRTGPDGADTAVCG